MANNKKNITISVSKGTSKKKENNKKVEKKQAEKIDITVTVISAGIISGIDPEGNIVYFSQRGIKQIPEDIAQKLISLGMLNPKAYMLKELPRNYSIHYEDSSIQGKASATYPIKRLMKGFID